MSPTRDAVPPDPEDEDDTRGGDASGGFAEALAAFERSQPAAPATRAPARAPLAPGGAVAGRVVSIHGDTVLIDIRSRSEAIADAREFRAEDGSLSIAPGQTIELHVLEVGESVVLGRSLPRATRGSLERVRQARTAALPVRGKVTAVNPGGVTVDLDGVDAFCPRSQLELRAVEDPSPYVGRVLDFLVTEVDESRHRVVVSHRRVLEAQAREQARTRLATLAPGQELAGTVTRLEPFGAFVDLGGLEGLVHVSEVSHARIAHPREVLAQGEQVRVRVLRVEPSPDGRARVVLSVRAAAPDPWVTAAARFAPGARVTGVVVRLAEFGAFVNLAPGLDGLVHLSQLSARRVTHVRDVLAVGQAVEAIVLAVEPGRRRISLSIREALLPGVEPSRVQPAADDPASPARAGPEPVRTSFTSASSEEPLTAMQLAFRRAREQASRSGEDAAPEVDR